MPRIRNILFDRDGTIIVDKHYQHDPDELEFLDGAVDGLRRMADAGMRLFILTNQSGIGRGYFSQQQMDACTARLDAMLAEHGISVVETVCCPHGPDDRCACRKPETGMWEYLRSAHGLLPEESVMVGDKIADVQLGLNAGLAASVLVLTGKGEKQARKLGLPELDSGTGWLDVAAPQQRWPHCMARDLVAAAGWIFDAVHEGDA